MTKLRTTGWFLLLLILLVTLVSFALAQETPTAAEGQLFQQDLSAPLPGELLARPLEETQVELSSNSPYSTSLPAISVNLAPASGDDVSPEPTGSFDTSGLDLPAGWQNPSPPLTSSATELKPAAGNEHLSDFSGLHVGLPQPAPSPSAAGANCTQLVVNPNLNPSGDFADPWDVLLGIIYLTNQAYVSPQHSLAFADNDVDDSSPNYDFFAQTIMIPSNLQSARIDFYTLALNSNDSDLTIVSLWTVDADGDLDEIIDAWGVEPTVENQWEGWFVEITDKETLQQLQGKDIALGFSSETTASPDNEIIFFDNITFTACQPDATNDTCRQVLANTKLDIDEFGDGTGSVEPWSIIYPEVYYTNVEGRAYDGYSLVLKDGDDDPSSPNIDLFAQGFLMPDNLTEVRVEYLRKTVNTNPADTAHGNLWLLDDDWVLHLDQPEKYRVKGWEVNESDGTWRIDYGTWDESQLMSDMAGRKMAILLFNNTDNTGAKEEVLFDNISLTACSKGAPGNKKVYMPSIMQKFGKAAGPICTPPNENPADQFHSNRGLVQTGANCNSTLSNVDRRDYYTFTPTTSGNHTLRLSNLPGGTEWAATIWLDIAKPTYAPGNSKAGICLTDQEGSGDKQVVCNLNKGTGYFVRIDSGSTPQAGGYTMRVTSP